MSTGSATRLSARDTHPAVASLRSPSDRTERFRACLVPALLALLAVQTWFVGGAVLAGGDLAPPLPPDRAYLSHWNPLTGDGGAPSYAIVQLPYHEVIRALEGIGLGASAAQRIWVSALFAGTAAAVSYYALGLGLPALAAAAAGVLISFSQYRLVLGFDTVPMAAIILACVLGGIVLRARPGEPRGSHVVVFAAVSAGSGYVFSNPPHLALVLLWLVVSIGLCAVLGGRARLQAAFVLLAAALPLVVVVNLWWVVPVAQTLLEPGFTNRYAAADPGAWAWTHRRASLSNALALNTAWGWNEPAYFPFARSLDRFPFDVLRYAPLGLALAGVAVARGPLRRVALLLVAVAAAAVFMTKGLHPPLEGVNAWLYEQVPGYWLFREPFKLLMLVALAFAILGGIAVGRLLASPWRAFAVAAAVVLVGGTILSAYPMITGTMYEDRDAALGSPRISIPDDWHDAAATLNSLPPEGKVLVLPEADFYQLPTTWGYYGVPFTRLAVHRPVLEPTPGGYFRPEGILSEIVAGIQADLLAGDGSGVPAALDALGVRYVLLRHDLDTLSRGRSLADPGRLAEGLVSVPGLRLMRSFDLLDVYVFDGARGEVAASVPVLLDGSLEQIPEAVHVVPDHHVLVTPSTGPPQVGSGFVWRDGVPAHVFRIDPDRLVRVQVHGGPRGTQVRLVDAVRVTLDGNDPRLVEPIQIRFPGISLPALLNVDGFRFRAHRSPDRAWTDLGFARVSRNAHLVLRPVGGARRPRERDLRLPLVSEIGTAVTRGGGQPGAQPLVPPPDPIDLSSHGPISDCNRYDERTIEDVELSASTVRSDGLPALQLVASDHAACVSFPLEPFHAAASYRIELEARAVTGSPPRVCLWEVGAERCAELPPLEPADGWSSFEGIVRPDAATRAARLFLYADAGGGEPTVTQYRNVRVEPVAQASVFALQMPTTLPPPQVGYTRVGPTEFHVTVEGARGPFLLSLAESFAPGWRIEAAERDASEVRHVSVSGYANGWLIPWTGAYELRIVYGPERLARMARWVSALAFVILSVIGFGAWVRERRRMDVTGKGGRFAGVSRNISRAITAVRTTRTRADLSS